MTTITILVGNPKPDSRTLTVCQAVASSIAAALEEPTVRTVDLVCHADRLFAWPDDILAEVSDAVSSSDVVVVGSPTYKGTYTGMLKAFLDRYPKSGLETVVAVPVMTGSDLSHSLGPDIYLRSLLVELGASVPSPSLYFTVPRLPELKQIVDAWARRSIPLIVATVAARQAMARRTNGPSR